MIVNECTCTNYFTESYFCFALTYMKQSNVCIFFFYETFKRKGDISGEASQTEEQ